MDIGKLAMWGGIGYAAYWFYEKYYSASAPVTALVNVTATPAATVTPASAAAAVTTPAVTMDSLYQGLKAAVAGDTFFTGSGDALTASPDHWNYYLKIITGVDADLNSLYGTPGNVGRDSGTTAANFWSLVSPQVARAKGLAGLGIFGGLGDLVRSWN